MPNISFVTFSSPATYIAVRSAVRSAARRGGDVSSRNSSPYAEIFVFVLNTLYLGLCPCEAADPLSPATVSQ